MWWILGATLLYLELLGAGIAFLNRSLGEKQWYLALIPVYGLQYLGRAAGVFKVLAVPVKKCALFFAELLIVAFLCGLYWYWGVRHVVPKGAAMLGQIMLLPIAICYGLMYLSILSASLRIYKRFYVKRLVWVMLASMLLLPVPFIYYAIKDRKAMPLSEMFD
jgi:hypothetical protein